MPLAFLIVAITIEGIFINFLWFGDSDNRKLSLVKWCKFLRDKKHKGLGLISLISKNNNILFK